MFTGETSAGKSSILNLLLGEDTLPVKLLSCTSTICRVINRDRKGAKVYFKNDNKPSKTLDGDNIHERLAKYIASENIAADPKERANNPVEMVDIFWPLPMLKVSSDIHLYQVYIYMRG